MKSTMKQTALPTTEFDARPKAVLVTIVAYAALFATWLVYQLA